LVEQYLADLLYDYDCVTIPGLGGFIIQQQPSKINRSKNRISPPTRYPAFNSLLSHDDGLLIGTIAKAGKLSYREAGNIVDEFARNCKKRILSGEKVILENIGELFSGGDGAIVFSQSSSVNFHGGVYGMEPVTLVPLSTIQDQARLVRKPDDRKPRMTKEKKPASVKWTLILSLPVIVFLLYGIIFPSSIHQLYKSYTGFIPGFRHTEVIHKMLPVETPVLTVAPKETARPAAIVAEPLQDKSQKYYIIGGCFENEENAGKFIEGLIKRGFEAEKAGTNNRGQIRISYRSFHDKAPALTYLQMIRNEENNSAWLLKY